ncbi:MAG TPA: TonB-dependent receptor [Bacteroidales bacterium]|nr:TonB-dependent receptor [Bacteroidales bacterium]
MELKIVFLILLVSVSNVLAIPVYSQTAKVSLDMENISLEQVMDEIESQSEFYFIFNQKQIDVNRVVSIQDDNKLITDILPELFNGTNVNYLVFDRKILLTTDPLENNLLAIASATEAQQNRVTGTVTDKDGASLPGVNIVVTGTTVGAITDINGKYSIEVPQGSKSLTFTFIGMEPQEVSIGTMTQIDVTMTESAIGLGEVVVIGFGTAKKENLTGAISNIKTEGILTTTHTSLAQSLAGKVAGLQIRQNSGEPGRFDESINIRGFGSPLYIIDGITRGSGVDFQKLNPEDIESISVIKDASAAIFGINAANGVVIVTTKRGAEGKVKFRIHSVIGTSTPTNLLEMCNSSQYMDIRNDADVNAGRPAYISKEELDKYHAGGPGYESTDWYDATFKSHAVMQQHTFSAEGGNKTVSYFTSIGYQNEGSFMRSGDMYYKKYNFRANINSNFTKNLVAQIDLSGFLDERYQPGNKDYFFIYKGTTVSLPTDKVYANNNPAYLSNTFMDQSPVAFSNANITGYISEKNKVFTSKASLTYTVPFVKGLKIKGIAAYDTYNGLDKSLSKSYFTYAYDALTDNYLPKLLRSPSSISNSYSDNNFLILQGHVIYNTKLADVHNIGVTLVYEQKQSWSRIARLSRDYDAFYTNDQINQASTTNQQTSGNESESATMSYLGRFNYDYKSKYLVEFAFRYDGSYRYHPDSRWGFFPVVSGGWRLSEENFIKDNIPFLSNLKIRASYGLVGEDAGNPFQYTTGFTTTGGGGYEFTNGSYLAGAAFPSIANEKLTWYTSNIKDIGLEFDFFRGKLSGEFDVYQRDREGLLATRVVSLPNTFGASLPQENLNGDRTRGIDFSIGHNNNIGKFHYSVKANFNFVRTMNCYVERAPYTSSWDRWKNGNTDRWNDMIWGYSYAGQFQTIDEVIYYPGQNGTQGNLKELPGDYKYEDITGDGVINNNDMLPLLWNGQPKLFYGITFNGQWKGFDFNALFQGSGKYTLKFNANYVTVLMFNGANQPAYFWDRWHLSDPYDPTSAWVAGKYPPSRMNKDVGSMYKESDRWRYDASYLRFKNLGIGYTFAQTVIKKVGLSNLRVYCNASNIFTICQKIVKPFDPEKLPESTATAGNFNSGYTYPLTKSFNFGINVTF